MFSGYAHLPVDYRTDPQLNPSKHHPMSGQ